MQRLIEETEKAGYLLVKTMGYVLLFVAVLTTKLQHAKAKRLRHWKLYQSIGLSLPTKAATAGKTMLTTKLALFILILISDKSCIKKSILLKVCIVYAMIIRTPSFLSVCLAQGKYWFIIPSFVLQANRPITAARKEPPKQSLPCPFLFTGLVASDQLLTVEAVTSSVSYLCFSS